MYEVVSPLRLSFVISSYLSNFLQDVQILNRLNSGIYHFRKCSRLCQKTQEFHWKHAGTYKPIYIIKWTRKPALFWLDLLVKASYQVESPPNIRWWGAEIRYSLGIVILQRKLCLKIFCHKQIESKWIRRWRELELEPKDSMIYSLMYSKHKKWSSSR